MSIMSRGGERPGLQPLVASMRSGGAILVALHVAAFLILCCTEADGNEAQEDIRDGHYWTTWPAVAPVWYPVPDEVVIRGPNKIGRPVVWTYWENGTLHIRCYAPGGGV